MKRNPDCIKPQLFDIGDILSGDIDILKFLPELSGFLRTNQLRQYTVNQPGRSRIVELKHVSFRHQPISEIGSTDKQFLAIGSYNRLSGCSHKPGVLGIKAYHNKKHAYGHRDFPHHGNSSTLFILKAPGDILLSMVVIPIDNITSR